ncbi:sulfotransferase family 2 domain-containing protein [Pararhodobacter sp. CCB-MM2]|uniref:sulfotransferase family 2 domain-containing protein n=1 Tax=Pararhodobacter sp. CCB-MM2 TaxID=1786003 RepID=UPI0008353B03|nr:sulfotransferase family 2 domain-containing protein [Pararhodobacter sp. CCB-MM2]
MPALSARIVFLHIPKTAGQTIHSELTRVMGAAAVSPVRVHTQAPRGEAQLPAGYRLYSGHIDWEALDTVPEPRFVFTVFRDPLERIASFYFYIRRQAEGLSAAELASPTRTGMRMALEQSPDDYFMNGPAHWQKFIVDHYHSPYCSYLATRQIRGYSRVVDLSEEELLARALEGAEAIDAIYTVEDLGRLERDLKERFGFEVQLTGRYVNAGPEGSGAARWPKLLAQLQRDETRDQLERFARTDRRLMERLGLLA